MTEPATPRIVTRDEWERARAELLVREKAHTRAGDELAAARRRLPMTRIEPVMVVGPDGPVPLHDVFEGRRMLIVYHFMWNKGAPHHKQCEGCTHSQTAMNSGRPCAICCRAATCTTPYSAVARGMRSSPTETLWGGRRRGTRPPTPEACWRPEMVVTSAATYGPATRCLRRMKRSGGGSRPCCPLCSCSTSLRTAGRRRGRTHPPDGRKTALGRGGGVMAVPLLSGRVPTQRSNSCRDPTQHGF